MNQPSKGFTLVELVVVLAIIGMLVAIFYPVYQDYTDPVVAVSEMQAANRGCGMETHMKLDDLMPQIRAALAKATP